MVQDTQTQLAVLFVCLGNICRSPMAEGAFRKAAIEAGLECEVDSVGTASYHIGEAPDPRAIATARANGVDIAGSAGRQLTPRDFDRFSHIIALDTANLAGIKAQAPRAGRAKVALLMDAVPGREGQSVKDPYYGTQDDFDAVWDEITLAVGHLVAQLRTQSVNGQI